MQSFCSLGSGPAKIAGTDMDTTSQTRSGLIPSSAVGRTLLVAVGVGTLVGAGFGLGLLSPGTEVAKAEQLPAPAAAPEAADPLADPTSRALQASQATGTAVAEQADPELIGLDPQNQPTMGEPSGAQDPAPTHAPADQPGPGQFYVQVASFRQREAAERRAQALTANGQHATTVEEGRWHIVRLGPFAARADAEKQRLALAKNERLDAFVLPRSNGLYHVQVASFESKEVAERIAKSYSDAGHNTKVTRVRMAGRYWHCVRIGPFDTREEALSYQKLVANKPGMESRVIPFEADTD